FTNREVVAFDRLLRTLYALAHEPALYGHSFLHSEREHKSLDALAAEYAHQIVFKREVEPRRAGIALTTGTAAQLIVDAARLVPFGAEYVQSAEADDFDVFGFGDDFRFLDMFLKLFRGRFVRVHLLFLEELFGEKFRIASEQNVRAATGHVG